MEPEKPPIITIRRVGDLAEYYIQQGKFRITFFVDQRTLETLIASQQAALEEFERRAEPRVPSLRVISAGS